MRSAGEEALPTDPKVLIRAILRAATAPLNVSDLPEQLAYKLFLETGEPIPEAHV